MTDEAERGMTDAIARDVLLAHMLTLRGATRKALTHVLRAMEHREELERRLWTVKLPDGLAIYCDQIRRHIKGESETATKMCHHPNGNCESPATGACIGCGTPLCDRHTYHGRTGPHCAGCPIDDDEE
jgi:hypothetical protein